MVKINCVYIDEDLLHELLDLARHIHPREILLILRGKKAKEKTHINIHITDYIVPPAPTFGYGFSSYKPHLLPLYTNIIGTFHNHPSGNPTPSIIDLHNSIGLCIIIATYPYKSIQDIHVYDRDGQQITLKLNKKSKQ